MSRSPRRAVTFRSSKKTTKTTQKTITVSWPASGGQKLQSLKQGLARIKEPLTLLRDSSRESRLRKATTECSQP